MRDNRSTQQRGQRGELIAQNYLRARGYQIVATNWRCAQGEVDIVARKGEGLVFVEVRARAADSTEAAFESISPRKQRRMKAAVYAYLAAHQLGDDALWQIDVIAIALRRFGQPLIAHVENALDW